MEEGHKAFQMEDLNHRATSPCDMVSKLRPEQRECREAGVWHSKAREARSRLESTHGH